MRSLVLSLHRLSCAGAGVRAVLPLLIQIAPATHYELYHDWRKALEFCRALPDVPPREAVTFHMFWRERSGGGGPRGRRFGRKQALPGKAVYATPGPGLGLLELWVGGGLSGHGRAAAGGCAARPEGGPCG